MYDPTYSTSGFWDKIASLPRRAGRAVISKAITLFVILTKDDTPPLVKASILTALSYFILPLDLVPDFLPGGFVDDVAVMSAALAKLNEFVTPEVKGRVAAYMQKCL